MCVRSEARGAWPRRPARQSRRSQPGASGAPEPELNQFPGGFLFFRSDVRLYRRSRAWRPEPGSSNLARTPRVRLLADALGARRGDRTCAGPARATNEAADARSFPRGRAAGPRSVRARRHALRPSRRSPPPSRPASAHLRPRRLRRRRHLRDRARRAAAARSSAPTWRGICRRRFEEGYGLNARDARRGSPQRAFDLVAHRRLRDHGGRRGRARATALGLEVVVTDHHRPGDDASRLPGRRDAQGRLSVRRALRHRRRLEARRRRCSAPITRSSTGTSTSSRSRRSPTSCRSSTRTARSRCSGLRRLAQTQKPGLRALMQVGARRSGGARRGRRSVSGSRRASTPPAGSAVPRPRSRCC